LDREKRQRAFSVTKRSEMKITFYSKQYSFG